MRLALDVSIFSSGDKDRALTVMGTDTSGWPTPLPYQRELCVFLPNKVLGSKLSITLLPVSTSKKTLKENVNVNLCFAKSRDRIFWGNYLGQKFQISKRAISHLSLPSHQ